jgi:DNA repair exonuclease SbcCD ATPase subunit
MADNTQDTLVLQELVRRANSHTQRLRNIDEQIRLFNSKFETIDQQKIKTEGLVNERFEKIEKALAALDQNLNDLKGEISKVHEREKTYSKKKEVEELSELINLLSPIKHEFVTWNEFNREIKKLRSDDAFTVRT